MSEEDKRPSVYSDKLKESIEAIPEELHSSSEIELRNKVRPDIKLYEIKRAFWEEMCHAQDSGKKMRIWRIYDEKVSRAYFYKDILTDPAKMAWITSPLVSYEQKTKAALDMVTERYNELIMMDITSIKKIKTEDGEYVEVKETDPKKALVLLQVIKNLEDRIKGTSIQRQVSVSAGSPTGKGGVAASLNMTAVEERLAELEDKLNGGAGDGEKDRLEQADVRVDDGKDGGIESNDIEQVSYRVVE